MKSKITLVFALLMFSGMITFAQQQRQSVEDRVKNAMEKISAPLKLDADQIKKTSAVFTTFYDAQSKKMEEIRGSGSRPDRSVFEKITTERDEKLKEIFSADQYKKFKDEVEETIRPQRRNS
ncbi:MAG: hypothetical protein ABIN48_03440 [Ginsengibacter sp.]